MAVGATPPGWYPDPWQQGAVRWWDGLAWTGYATSLGPGADLRLDDEERLASRARVALLAVIPFAVAGQVGLLLVYDDLFDRIRADRFEATPDVGALAVSQLSGLASIVAGVLFLLWFFRAAENARSLGLPARREPGLATASFMIPVLNLWWPYRSTCDLLPPGHPARPRVLRWWLLWIVGGLASAMAMLIGAAVGGVAAWALVVGVAVQQAAAALAARQVVADVLAAHLERVGGVTPRSSGP